MLDRLKSLYYLLEFKQDESNPEKLILLGKNIFKDNFITNILEILETYPNDLINSKGQPFWSGKKIKPKLLKINDIGINYYYSLLKILGNTNSGIFDTSYIERLSNCIGNKFNLESKFIRKLNIDEEKDKVNIEVSEEEIDYYEGLINNFTNQQDIYKKIENICKYDKDLQEHNELMTILVNLRAKCYSITETDNLSVKLISGKVVPAISTTTSVIAAFVIIYILKYLNSSSKKSLFKPCEVNINLADNQYNIYESSHPKISFDGMFS